LELDKKNSQILFELDKNSRISINKIAKKIKLSRDVVRYRIKQLEKQEIIQKYIAIIDFTKLGYQNIRLYLRLKNTSTEIEEKMINYLINQKNIFTVYKTDGKYDLAIGFFVKDLQKYQIYYEKFLKIFKPYILKKKFSICLNYVHFNRNYLTEKKYYNLSPISIGSSKFYQYDNKDIQLLNLIKEDARISLLDLSKKMKMTPTGIKYKLKNLEKNKVIMAYKVLINFDKFGYKYYKIDLDLEDVSIIPSLKQYVIQHPNIIYQDIFIGGSDFEFDCELLNQQELYKIFEDLKKLFPEKIRNYHYYKALKIYKYSYFPEDISC